MIQNNFVYQLELNELSRVTTKAELLQKITLYNKRAFQISGQSIIYLKLPYLNNPKNRFDVVSMFLYYDLQIKAINRFAELYDIKETPKYVQNLYNTPFTLQLKELNE